MRSIVRPVVYMGIASLLPFQWCFAVAQKPITYDICVTQRTAHSPCRPVPTYYHLLTATYERDVFVTITLGTTKTPKLVTQTSTISTTITTESDVPQVTDTFTVTDTTTATVVDNLPTFTITDSTSTSTTSTSTILDTTTVGVPDGFQPVQSTLPNSAAKKKRLANYGKSPKAGSLLAAVHSPQNQRQPICPPAHVKLPPSWPAAVTCYGVVEDFVHKTVTKTARRTTTVTAPTPTTTFLTTTTLTSTNVVTTPDASTFVTLLQTDTSTSTNAPTTTITTTSTSTIVVPSYTATAYAICNPSNFAGAVNGHGIDSTGSPTGTITVTNTKDSSAQECCSSCAANPLCSGSSFYGGFPAGQQCYNFLVPGPTCSFGQIQFPADYLSYAAPDTLYSVSNGNCGLYNQAVLQH